MPSVTLTADATTASRVVNALGQTLGLQDAQGNPRAATLQEYHDWLIDVSRRMVQGTEFANAQAQVAAPAAVPIT